MVTLYGNVVTMVTLNGNVVTMVTLPAAILESGSSSELLSKYNV